MTVHGVTDAEDVAVRMTDVHLSHSAPNATRCRTRCDDVGLKSKAAGEPERRAWRVTRLRQVPQLHSGVRTRRGRTDAADQAQEIWIDQDSAAEQRPGASNDKI